MTTRISTILRQFLPALFVCILLTQCSKDDDEKFPFRIMSIEPDFGPVGTLVAIRGRGFKETQTVTFNGVEAPIHGVSTALIITEVPPNATTGALMIHEGAISPQQGRLFMVIEP